MRAKFKKTLIFGILSPAISLISLIWMPINPAAFIFFAVVSSIISVAFFTTSVVCLIQGIIEKTKEAKIKKNCLIQLQECDEKIKNLTEQWPNSALKEKWKNHAHDANRMMSKIVQDLEKEKGKLEHEHQTEYDENILHMRYKLLESIMKFNNSIKDDYLEQKLSSYINEIFQLRKQISQSKLNQSSKSIVNPNLQKES